jgi:hypothetical protein
VYIVKKCEVKKANKSHWFRFVVPKRYRDSCQALRKSVELGNMGMVSGQLFGTGMSRAFFWGFSVSLALMYELKF